MTNMSYCRFENTYHDLKDCIENFTDLSDLSKSERVYKLRNYGSSRTDYVSIPRNDRG